MCYTNNQIKEDLNILSKSYNFKINFFESGNTILVENNLERWFIKICENSLALYHGNKNDLSDGKICSYHIQKQRSLERDTLIYFFRFIKKHGNKKIYGKTKLERLFDQIS